MEDNIGDGNEFEKLYTRVEYAYVGLSILLTGASGFIGTIILETLLRCCPGIKNIYILLREKKDQSPEERKEEIFKKSIFWKVKEKMPDSLKKVIVIPGDMTLCNLGMKDSEAKLVAQEVSIVFHTAAVISFFKPFDYIMKNNFIGIDNVVEFCKKCKKIKALIFTSTAYSNCYILKEPIEEIIYPLPKNATKILECFRLNQIDDALHETISQWPIRSYKTYFLSKRLCEKLLLEKAEGLPFVIIRPPITISCWKGPRPGYVEEGSTIVLLQMACLKGLIRVIKIDPDKHVNYIPVDIVANIHIVAAWSLISKRCSSPQVVNCTIGNNAPTWRDYAKILNEFGKSHQIPKGFMTPSVIIHKNTIMYWLYSIFEHYLPAFIMDIMDKKSNLVKLYKFYGKLNSAIEYHVGNDWTYNRTNFKKLVSILPSEDKKNFYLDYEDCTLEQIYSATVEGAPFYDWKIDKRSIEERRLLIRLRTFMASTIKVGTIVAIILIFLIASLIWKLSF